MMNIEPLKILRGFVVLAVTAGSFVSMGCEPDLPQMDPDLHSAEIQAWQVKRVEGLKAPTGWLSVIGLDWLEPGENDFGADEELPIALSSVAGLPSRGGTFNHSESTATSRSRYAGATDYRMRTT